MKGFGEVKFAKLKKKSKTEENKVAIKILKNLKTKQKLNNLNEVNCLRLLENENIVKMICCFENKEKIYIVTEFLEGGSLKQACENFKFNEDHIAYISKQILSGLSFMHQNNFIHRYFLFLFYLFFI